MKAKLFFTSSLASLTLMFTGCTPSITNITTPQVRENPSGIYTLTMAPRGLTGAVVKNDYDAYVVIDGEEHSMGPSDVGEGFFDFDYAMPGDQFWSKYYYLLKKKSSDREIKSDLYHLELINRYVESLEATRGPVGTSIAVIGRGFSSRDKISVGGFEAATTFVSQNHLSFVVPPLPSGDSYTVELDNGKGTMAVGNFHVDGARLNVRPQRLELAPGQKIMMVFQIDFAAPAGGLPIEVTTDVPESIIMQDVKMPAGSQTISVQIEGGSSGEGVVYVSAPGFNEVEIPLTVLGSY